MLPRFRARFNEQFSDLSYRAFFSDLTRRAGGPLDFRVSETPCFFPKALMDALSATAVSMTTTLLDDGAYREAADRVVPARFRVARQEARPAFIQVDFGLVRERGAVEGRLVELQAFPSLYGFQFAMAEAYAREYALLEDGRLTPFLGGLTSREAYIERMRRALVGRHDPAQVVLLEIEPHAQKTRPDFVITEELWGVRAIDVQDVIVDGPRLFYRREGSLTRIARIYNRVIPDELDRRGLTLPFAFSDDLDVEWLGSPDWYFRLSKFSIPFLRHPWVPITCVLSDALDGDRLGAAFADRERWILKPLFSFAGGGIIFGPSDAEIAAIPPEARGNYIVQERVAFSPVIQTPDGPTQVEIRIMLVLEDGVYHPVLPLLRMGRGKMMGVDHNKGLSFVGASAGFVSTK